MKIKKMLVIPAVAIMAVTVAGCNASTQGGSDTGKEVGKETKKETEKGIEKETEKEKAGDAAGSQRKSISLMTPYLGSVTANRMVEYMEQELTDAGAETSVINTNNDFPQLTSRLGGTVSMRTDGTVLISADPGRFSDQLQDVFESEIPAFGCDSGFTEGMQVNVTSDNYQMGELIMKYLFDGLMGGRETVIALTHRPHLEVVKRCEAFDDLTKGYPDITPTAEQHVPTEQPTSDTQDIMENLLLTNPDSDSITAIWTVWDEPATGATQALQEAGRNQALVMDVDGNEQAVSLTKEGANLKATIKQNLEGVAQTVYEQMDRYFRGEKIEKGETYALATLTTQESAGAQRRQYIGRE